jgi:hypothetical protein
VEGQPYGGKEQITHNILLVEVVIIFLDYIRKYKAQILRRSSTNNVVERTESLPRGEIGYTKLIKQT